MRRIGVGIAAAVLVLAAAGCGGSKDSADAVAESTVTETAATTDTSETADTSESTDASTSTDASIGEEGLSGECKDLVDASKAYAAAVAASSSGGTEMEANADALAALAAKAPDELKDDFETLADVMAKYAEAFKDVDLKSGEVPSTAQIAKLVQLSKSFNTEDVRKASAAITAWSTKHC